MKEAMAEHTIEDDDDVAVIANDHRERILEEFNESFLDVEDDTPETVEDADERLRTEITDEYSLQQERVNNITDMLEEAQIPRLEVSGNRKVEQVAERIKSALQTYLPPNRQSIFEKVTPISHQAGMECGKGNILRGIIKKFSNS